MSIEAERNLGYQLRRAQLAFRTRMDAALKPLGVTAPQYSVLASLASEPGASNADLARAALVTPQSMQGLVANLEKLGLIERTRDPEHGRILQGRLTREGKSVLASGHRVAARIEAEMLRSLDKAEIGKVAEILAAFVENLRPGS